MRVRVAEGFPRPRPTDAADPPRIGGVVAFFAALVLIGALMMDGIRHIEWDQVAEGVPAFLTIIVMPLTFSIANGVSMGIISYCAIKVFTGRGKDVHWALYIVAALLLARYIWLDAG